MANQPQPKEKQQPSAGASIAPAPSNGKSKKGLWIGLGIAAVTVVAVLLFLRQPKPLPADPDTQAQAQAQTQQQGGTGTANGHEWVDLGLPSGTLWATCNVGAGKPEDYGSYYAWGETSTKSTYNWDTYKYVNGDYNKLTKYCNKSDYGNNGFTDNLTTLQAGDDPATAKWGSGWRTSSKAQWDELLSNTTRKWTTQNGKKGYLFTSKKNGQSVFLPAAGSRWVSELYYAGSIGSYWSRSLFTYDPNNAWYLYFDSDDCGVNDGYGRGRGFSVRPVREK